MDAYGCEAPKFTDLININEADDRYFDLRNEDVDQTNVHEPSLESISSTEGDFEQQNEFYTPMQTGRLSISMVCLSEINQYNDDNESEANASGTTKSLDMNKDSIDNNDNNLITTENAPLKGNPTKETKSRGRSVKLTPRSNKSASLRARSNSGTRWTALAKPKPQIQSKYVSMQEFLNKFERSTPLRFHSKPKTAICSTESLNGPMACTIPYSPALQTKGRIRPTTCVSTHDLETKEYEEQKKFKIKANPVNRKVLGPVRPLQPIKKTPTQQLPFNITEVAPKKSPAPEESLVKAFHARPAPVAKPAQLQKVVVQHKMPTCPVTPNVLKHSARKEQSIEPPTMVKQEWTAAITKLKPFSFEERDKRMKTKLEEQRMQLLAEEKKMREFRSKPMPKKIYLEPTLPVKLNKKAESLESVKSTGKPEEIKPFKARPPTSIMKEPFIPKKIERPPLEIIQLELNTEKRTRERDLYNEKLRERERELEIEKQKRFEEEQRKQIEEMKEKRKDTVHIPRAIAKFKGLPEMQHKPLTLPMTPQVVARYKDKENSAQPR